MTRRMLLQAAAAVPRSPYVDWSWDKWREITAASPINLTTEQTGQASLSALVPPGMKAADWPTRRAELRRVIGLYVGEPPKTKPPLDVRMDGEERIEGGVIRRRIRFQSEPGEVIPGYLFLPAALRGKTPAILSPHQTTQFAKDEPAGLRGNPRLAMAIALAKRGYVTLTCDAVCFGERHDTASGHYGDAIPFYRRHPRWSIMGKIAWDLSRAVDFLEQQSFVDSTRIASIGHSHGGYTTWFSMALDERIACGVSSCGFDTFRHDGNPYRWSHATALLPRLGFHVSNPAINIRNYSGVPDSGVVDIPFDMHWVLALIAPRPLMLTAADDDHVFPNSGWSTRQAEARLLPLYEMLGGDSGRLTSHYFRGGHAFPPEAEQRAFAFIDRWLRPGK